MSKSPAHLDAVQTGRAMASDKIFHPAFDPATPAQRAAEIASNVEKPCTCSERKIKGTE
jgi:hypothetical protein